MTMLCWYTLYLCSVSLHCNFYVVIAKTDEILCDLSHDMYTRVQSSFLMKCFKVSVLRQCDIVLYIYFVIYLVVFLLCV